MTVTGNVAQKAIATATGIDQSSISRWLRGTNTPSAEAVVAFARVYGRSPVEALVAADYLSSTELGVAELTTLTGDLTMVSIDSLLSELRRRVLPLTPRTRRPGRRVGPPITREWAGIRMARRAAISAADRSSGRTRDITCSSSHRRCGNTESAPVFTKRQAAVMRLPTSEKSVSNNDPTPGFQDQNP